MFATNLHLFHYQIVHGENNLRLIDLMTADLSVNLTDFSVLMQYM